MDGDRRADGTLLSFDDGSLGAAGAETRGSGLRMSAGASATNDSGGDRASGDERPAGWLVGLVATLALLLGAVGVGTGDVPRVLRNEPVPASMMFVFVLLGSLCAVLARRHPPDPPKQGEASVQEKPEAQPEQKKRQKREARRRSTWAVLSGVAFSGAVLAALAVGICSALESPEPGVSAEISTDRHGRSMLRFEVTDSGVKSSAKMTIKVKSLSSGGSPAKPTLLYAASLGPDSAGKIDRKGELQVPPPPASDIEVQAWTGKAYSCYQEGTKTGPGCVKVHIARRVDSPQLTISWRNKRHSKAGLFIFVSSHGVGAHGLALRVIDANTFRRLLIVHWPAGSNGDVTKAVTAVIPQKTRKLCVAASATRRPNCSLPPASGTASVMTGVPPP